MPHGACSYGLSISMVRKGSPPGFSREESDSFLREVDACQEELERIAKREAAAKASEEGSSAGAGSSACYPCEEHRRPERPRPRPLRQVLDGHDPYAVAAVRAVISLH
jgi:hypothetical protein